MIYQKPHINKLARSAKLTPSQSLSNTLRGSPCKVITCKLSLKSASAQREPGNAEPEATPKQAPAAVILSERMPCVYGQRVKH